MTTSDGRRRFVVGVDGSEESHAALAWALRKAAVGRPTTVEVVHAWSFPPEAYLPAGSAKDLRVMDIDACGRELVDASLRAVPAPSGVEVRRRVVEGHPAETLLRETNGADLLVVGRRGRGRLAGLLLGSTSEACVQRAGCPVVVVPGGRARARRRRRGHRLGVLVTGGGHTGGSR